MSDLPQYPVPRTKAEFSALLDVAIELANELSKTIDASFPAGTAPPAMDLTGLTLDQKMALGDQAAAELGALAYRIAPETVLDCIETGLSQDTASSDQAAEVLRRASRPG